MKHAGLNVRVGIVLKSFFLNGLLTIKFAFPVHITFCLRFYPSLERLATFSPYLNHSDLAIPCICLFCLFCGLQLYFQILCTVKYSVFSTSSFSNTIFFI